MGQASAPSTFRLRRSGNFSDAN